MDEACACCSLRHPEITEWVENEKHLAGLKEQEAEQEQAKEGPDYEKLAQIKSGIIRLEAEPARAAGGRGWHPGDDGGCGKSH